MNIIYRIIKKILNEDDYIEMQRSVIADQREVIAILSKEFMDLVYKHHGEEGTKLTPELYREISNKLDKPPGTDVLDITVQDPTVKDSCGNVNWDTTVPNEVKVTFYRAGYIIPKRLSDILK